MSIKNLLSSAVFVAAGVVCAHGLEVEVTAPGTLSESVTDPSAVTQLTLSGTVNAADLYYIGMNMTGLTSLDMSRVTIDEYMGTVVMGRTFYPAATLPYGVFMGLPLTSVTLPQQSGLVISEGAFMNTSLTSLPTFENVDSIGQAAFAGCNSLQTLTMPKTKMNSAVFADCTALTTVDMGTATEIPALTFHGCTALTTINGAANIVSIGDRAFEGDTSLKTFDFGQNLRYVGSSAFAATGLTEIDMSRALKLEEINREAFADSKLQSAILPDNVATIGDGVFFGNNSMKEIQLPAALITLGEHSLVSTRLREIKLPDNVEEIGAYALKGQTNITGIYLPPSLIYIGDNGMEGMTALSRIDVRDHTSVPELGENVWEGVNPSKVFVTVNANYINDFENALQWKDFNFNIIAGAEEIVDDQTAGRNVRGRFVGTDLQIESIGADIDIVRLFDTAGRLLLSVEPRSTTATIDTSDFPGGVFIVNIVLDDKTPATLKLARK